MRVNLRMIGAGAAAAIAASVGYILLSRPREDAVFRMVTRDGDFSVRDYAGLRVAEVVVPGLREAALSVGFDRLAEFVFGRGCGGWRLPVPFFSDGDEDGRGWRARLLMPAGLAGGEGGAAEVGVQLRTLPARRLAALRFAGPGGEGALDAYEAELRAWIGANGLRPAGPVEHAFYNSPFTPGPLRRTEVLIPLAA